MMRKNETHPDIAVPEPSVGKQRDEHSPLILITGITNNKIVLRPDNVLFFKYDTVCKQWVVVLHTLQRFPLRHATTAETILNTSPNFVRIHKMLILNLHFLAEIDGNICILSSPHEHIRELTISKIYKKMLLDRFSVL